MQQPLLSNGSVKKHVSTKEKIALQQMKGVFYAIRAEML
jgi:hypothetical protein